MVYYRHRSFLYQEKLPVGILCSWFTNCHKPMPSRVCLRVIRRDSNSLQAANHFTINQTHNRTC